MKKLIALLLALMLPCAALAFDNETLRSTAGCDVIEDFMTGEIIVCPVNQPYMGEMEDGMLMVWVDYIEKLNPEVTLLRLAVSVMIYDPMWADTVTLTVGGKAYAFAVEADQYEYDGIYTEDYITCLTDASLPFLKAVAQQKQDDPVTVSFSCGGEVVLTGQVIIPGEEAAQLYDRFVDLGGKQQELKSLDDMWPCEVTKVK